MNPPAIAAYKKKKKKITVLPRSTVEYLKTWILSSEHINHPYPTEMEKDEIMKDTGIEMKQLTNWFVNNRKPRVEAQMQKQIKAFPSPRAKRIEGHTSVSSGFPPAQVHFSSVESQNGFYGKLYDHQLKVHIGTKLTPFEPQTRGVAPNATSQIVSMGSACSFSSESDTHSITSDDQIFSPEDSTCSDKIKSNYLNQRKIITSDTHIRYYGSKVNTSNDPIAKCLTELTGNVTQIGKLLLNAVQFKRHRR